MRQLLAALTICSALAAPGMAAERLTADAVNQARWSSKTSDEVSPAIIKAQVLLDRAGFSPGEIDGRSGENFSKAVSAFQEHAKLEVTGKVGEATWAKLTEVSGDPILTEYTVSAADRKGPFVAEIPHDYEEMAKLKYLGYRDARELLAEKFHMSEDLLKLLNPEADLEADGAKVLVTSVIGDRSKDTATAKGGKSTKGAVARLVVNKSQRLVRAFDKDGGLVAYYPASVGSEEKPAPTGKFEVRAVAEKPTYRYNPDFKFKGQTATEPVEIAPGPNSPVGIVWIALSAETYGIHGTSEPGKVGKVESHGCVRLTNWDALELAKMVKKGTEVEFLE